MAPLAGASPPEILTPATRYPAQIAIRLPYAARLVAGGADAAYSLDLYANTRFIVDADGQTKALQQETKSGQGRSACRARRIANRRRTPSRTQALIRW